MFSVPLFWLEPVARGYVWNFSAIVPCHYSGSFQIWQRNVFDVTGWTSLMQNKSEKQTLLATLALVSSIYFTAFCCSNNTETPVGWKRPILNTGILRHVRIATEHRSRTKMPVRESGSGTCISKHSPTDPMVKRHLNVSGEEVHWVDHLLHKHGFEPPELTQRQALVAVWSYLRCT